MAKPRSKFKKVKWLFGKEIEIPEEWEITAQGRICQFINGYAYSQFEFREKGYPIIRIQNLTGGKNFVFSDIPLPEKQFAVNGDLLFAWSATFGPFIWHGYKAAFHYHQWKVIPSDEISKIFLYYHFTKIAPTVKQMGQSGLGMFHMTKSGMEKFPIALPPPSEQTKIASILSGVDVLIESTQKTIEKTERLKKGLMQKLLTKGIGHAKFKKVKWLFGKEIEIPEEWEKHQLKQIGRLSAGGTPSTFQKKFWNNGTIPWISSSEVKNNKITHSDKKITKLGLENSAAKIFPKGTVLIAITGFGMTRGRSAILEIDAATNQSIVGIQPKVKIIDGLFLWYSIQGMYWTIRNIAQGSQQPGLNLGILENFQICFPDSLSEQQKIASILSNADAYIQKNQECKKKMELLKKGLMQKLLTGQIRVKVDH